MFEGSRLEQSVAFLEFEPIFSIGVVFVILFCVVYPYIKDLKGISSRLTRNDSR